MIAHRDLPALLQPATGEKGKSPQTSRGSAMKVLAIGHMTGKDTQPYLEAERKRVAELRSQGLIRDFFLKADQSGPVLLLNDTTAEHARQQLATLPLVEHNLMTYDYLELDDASLS
jgi:hypothetical protein